MLLLLIAKWWSTLLTRPFLSSLRLSQSLTLSLSCILTLSERKREEREERESLKAMQVLFLEKVVRTVYLFKILSSQISHKSILQTFLPFPNDSFILLILPLLSFTTYDFNIWKVHLNVTRSERIRNMCESTFKKIQRERKKEWIREKVREWEHIFSQEPHLQEVHFFTSCPSRKSCFRTKSVFPSLSLSLCRFLVCYLSVQRFELRIISLIQSSEWETDFLETEKV